MPKLTDIINNSQEQQNAKLFSLLAELAAKQVKQEVREVKVAGEFLDNLKRCREQVAQEAAQKPQFAAVGLFRNSSSADNNTIKQTDDFTPSGPTAPAA